MHAVIAAPTGHMFSGSNRAAPLFSDSTLGPTRSGCRLRDVSFKFSRDKDFADAFVTACLASVGTAGTKTATRFKDPTSAFLSETA